MTEKDKQTSRESEESADVCDKSNFKSSMEQSLKVANSASNDGQPTSIPSKFIYFYQGKIWNIWLGRDKSKQYKIFCVQNVLSNILRITFLYKFIWNF